MRRASRVFAVRAQKSLERRQAVLPAHEVYEREPRHSSHLWILGPQIALQRLPPWPQDDAERARLGILENRIVRAAHVPGPAPAIDRHDLSRSPDQAHDLPRELVPGARAFVHQVVDPWP